MVEEGWIELGKAHCVKCFIGVVRTVFIREREREKERERERERERAGGLVDMRKERWRERLEGEVERAALE